MRILLSGGIKTSNIAKAIGKHFEASGDTINIVDNIENISHIFEKGDYFDKVLIAQPSITDDGRETDELAIRNKVNKFALKMRDRGMVSGNKEYVFLTQSEAIASMVSDEVIPLGTNVAVVLCQPPYSVKFFTDLLVTSVRNLPEEYVYVPEAVAPETFDDLVDSGEEFDDFDDFDGFDVDDAKPVEHQAPDDLSALMFGEDNLEGGVVSADFGEIDGEDSFGTGGADFGGDLDNTDFGGDGGTEAGLDGFEGTEDFGFGAQEVVEPTDDNLDDPFGNHDNLDENLDDPFGNHDNLDENLDGASGFADTTVKQSGDIPDFMESKSSLESNDYMYGNVEDDCEQHTETNGEPEVKEDNFKFETGDFNQAGPVNDFVENKKDYIDEQERDMGNNADFEGNLPGFDEDVYGNQDAGANLQMGGLEGFDDDMYNQPEPVNNTQEVGVQQDLNGFDSSMYENEPMMQNDTVMENNGLQSGIDIQQEIGRSMGQEEPVKEKRGLFGRRKKQPVQNAAVGKPNATPVKSVTSLKKLKDELDPFAARGNSILVTGCGGCGTSWVAFNLANIIHQLGYTVLLVDMDTVGRTQSYISKKTLESIEPDCSSLISAVNSTTGINAYQSVVKTGFHLLTNGLAADAVRAEDVLHKEKINRFANSAKSSHNFVVYDVPFELATTFLSDITYIADDIVCVTDTSNWGITKMMQSITNVSSDDMQEVLFAKTQILFNRQRNLNLLFGGSRIRTADNILKAIDKEILVLLGEDPGVYFDHLGIAGVIDDDPNAEASWYNDVQYSDTQKGQQIFLEVLRNIVLRRH